MHRVGIDPGVGGALAILSPDGYAEVVDMPVIPNGKRQMVDAKVLTEILDRWRRKHDLIVYLERVHTMPKQGVASSGSFMMSYGIVYGIVVALHIPLVKTDPQIWKVPAGLVGKEKDAARVLAHKMFPQVELARKKDVGRADALLIAKYGR